MRLESGCAERNRCALEIIINLLILISHCSKSFLEADPILLFFSATAKLQLVIELFNEIMEGSPDLTIADYNVNKITQLVGFYSDYQSYLLWTQHILAIFNKFCAEDICNYCNVAQLSFQQTADAYFSPF